MRAVEKIPILLLCAIATVPLACGAHKDQASGPKERPSSRFSVSTSFEGGWCPEYLIKGKTLTFGPDGTEFGTVHVYLRNAPDGLEVRVKGRHVDEKPSLMYRHNRDMGWLLSKDGEHYEHREYDKCKKGKDIDTLLWRLKEGGDVWVSTYLPYTRRHIDRLIRSVRKSPQLSFEYRSAEGRQVPVFQFGEDDGKKPVLFFVCGEDAWETGSMVFCDAMVRKLVNDVAFLNHSTERAVIRIVPALSPFSLSADPSCPYRTLDGRKLYAAATWGWEKPPPEIRVLRDELEELIKDNRLGFMTTVHSWAALNDRHSFVTIREAGDHKLTSHRLEWARDTVRRIMHKVPRGESGVNQSSTRGLARDYFLERHDLITFRLEVTTYRCDTAMIRQSAEKFLANIVAIEDWSPVSP